MIFEGALRVETGCNSINRAVGETVDSGTGRLGDESDHDEERTERHEFCEVHENDAEHKVHPLKFI